MGYVAMVDAYMSDIGRVTLKGEAMCDGSVQQDALMHQAHRLCRPHLDLGAGPTAGHLPCLIAVGYGLRWRIGNHFAIETSSRMGMKPVKQSSRAPRDSTP